jgi:lipoate-protein ligase A
VSASYRKTGEAVVRALGLLGISAQFCRSRSAPGEVRETANCFDLSLENEVAVCGTKVLGCAQLRRGNLVMQQNSLAVSPPAPEVARVFGVTHGGPAVYELANAECPEPGQVSKALTAAIEEVFETNLVVGELTHRERQSLARLEAKYRSVEWNSRRPERAGSQLTL